jgi:hypothetical protein
VDAEHALQEVIELCWQDPGDRRHHGLGTEREIHLVHPQFEVAQAEALVGWLQRRAPEHDRIFAGGAEAEAGADASRDLQADIPLQRAEGGLPDPAEVVAELHIGPEAH